MPVILANLLGTDTQITTADIADGVFQANKNLIINGAMQVAQRGTSYSQSPNSGNYHTVDRYSYRRSGTWSGVTAVELTQESSGGPVGFKNFLRYAPTGSDATTPDNACMLVDYKLEGQDISQLEWGTSNAKSITISFYVRSSVTGTFCLNIRNTSPTRQYVKEYTINSASTWERKELTFSGDTSGTWANDNGTGLVLMWFVSGDTDSPSESGRLVTADQWNATSTTNTYTANQSDAMTTSSGQTWDITGVQLEVGETATPFEHRSLVEEWDRCQRYCTVYNLGGGNTHPQNFIKNNHTVPGAAGHVDVANRPEWFMSYPIKRAEPTITVTDATNMRWLGSGSLVKDGNGAVTFPVGTSYEVANVFQGCPATWATSVVPEGWVYKNSGTNPSITIDAEL